MNLNQVNYIDNQTPITAANLNQIQKALLDLDNDKVNKSGDTMTGNLTVPRIQITPIESGATSDNYPRIVMSSPNAGTGKGQYSVACNNGCAYIVEWAPEASYYEAYYFPIPSADLTDDVTYYVLTSKNYYDYIYPKGSIYTTGDSAFDPNEKFSGTWTLIDKQLAYKRYALADYVTIDSTNTTSVTGYAVVRDHSLWLYGAITPKIKQENDTAYKMFTLKLSSLGCSALAVGGNYSSMSDGGNVVYSYGITTAGVFSITDRVRKARNDSSDTTYRMLMYGTIAADTAIQFQCEIPIAYTSMNNSACSQFIWKRTA